MVLTVNANSIHVTMTDNTVTSAIVHFTHAGIHQQEENGLKAKASGTVRNAIGFTTRMPWNA